MKENMGRVSLEDLQREAVFREKGFQNQADVLFTGLICLFLFYFSRHVPKAKATTMADTPELKRIQENTKLQSNVSYL